MCGFAQYVASTVEQRGGQQPRPTFVFTPQHIDAITPVATKSHVILFQEAFVTQDRAREHCWAHDAGAAATAQRIECISALELAHEL